MKAILTWGALIALCYATNKFILAEILPAQWIENMKWMGWGILFCMVVLAFSGGLKRDGDKG